MSNIVQEAKKRIYNSNSINYIKPEKIEEAFNKIYIFRNSEEFYKTYGRNDFESGRLEGFNRSSGSYLNPEFATTHTVIHEVLHGISSKFDNQGHRIENGIMGNNKYRFANQVNEGLTDYLASKLSGESPRNYIQGHRLFSKLEPMLVKYSKNPDIITQVYLKNDVGFLQEFLNRYGKKDTFENLYENFLFMDNEKIDNMMLKIDKNLNKDLRKNQRREKFNNITNKIKNIFMGKNQKLLTEGNVKDIKSTNNRDKHQQFINQYNVDNSQFNIKINEKQYNQKINTKYIDEEQR